jgi:hypothetical protein
VFLEAIGSSSSVTGFDPSVRLKSDVMEVAAIISANGARGSRSVGGEPSQAMAAARCLE